MLICEKCFEDIARESTRLARAYMELVSLSDFIGEDLKMTYPSETKEKTLHRLESLGYIITTDMEDYLVLRIIRQGQAACKDENHGN